MACNPVKFSDLGKDAKDLLEKNFHFGVVKYEGKTKSKSGVQFITKGNLDTDSGNITGGLDAKLNCDVSNLDITTKWTTNNVLDINASHSNAVKGLTTELDASFAPETGKKTAKLSSSFTHELFHSTHDIDITGGPLLHGSLVLGYKGALLGATGSFDVSSTALKSNGISLAYHGEGYKITSSMCDFARYGGSIHHKVSDTLSAAAAVSWSEGTSPSLTVASQYQIDGDSSMKVKVDNGLHVGLSYICKLRDGVQATLSALVNAKDINAGGHKLGLCLNFDA